jgi:DNA-nicking Smr family endonuclease
MAEQYHDPVPIEINGVLDLHHFSPKDLRYLVPDYLFECAERNITEVKIIHGKGKGILRRTVHELLEKNPQVHSYRQASEHNGSWGATIVQLKKKVNPDKA